LSYLNALASSGLSVGLRLYGTRPSQVSNLSEPATQELEECPKTDPAKATEKSAKAEPTPLTPEERAAGHADAIARLASAGSIGHLQESRAARTEKKGENANSDKATAATEDEDAAVYQELTEEEEKLVEQLKARDREVRAHEAAHKSAAGGMAGSPTYVYQTGPDGKRYAIGGEVSVRAQATDDPAKALSQAEAVQRAANAPGSPSSQDRAVASAASADITRIKVEAQKEEEKKAEERKAETEEATGQTAEPKAFSFFNGETISQKAVKAYETVKSSLNVATRPILARI
jgi:hypothetical protein